MDTNHPDFPERGAFQWRVLGYHFRIHPTLQLDALGGVESPDPWISLLSILEEAKAGNFSNLSRVVDCILAAEDWVLLRAAAEVLGDGGPASCLRSALERLRKLIFEDDETTIQIEFCRSLLGSHFLWAVPIITEIYLSMDDRREAHIIPISLAKLLSDEHIPYPEEAGVTDEAYQGIVLHRYEELRADFGNDEVPILGGKLYSVRHLASDFLTGLKSEDGVLEADFFAYRHKFEAATGIDCSEMFHDSIPQPLVAVAIMEEFLQGPELTKYQDGIRYFFGHRIPD